jgi:hypothetical protein
MFFSLMLLTGFAAVLFFSYKELNLEDKIEVRLSAIGQAEGLHNLRVNCFIFLIAAVVRSNWEVAIASVIAFWATYLWVPKPTIVQGGTKESELGFYLAFALVVPLRLLALVTSAGDTNEPLTQVSLTCMVVAVVVLCLPIRGVVHRKMKGVLAPWHNICCAAFLILVTPVVGEAAFGFMHLLAGLILLSVSMFRGCNSSVGKAQLAFFLHWPLPLFGGRLPVALFVLGGSFSLKAGVILAVSVLAWSSVIGFHKSRLLALLEEVNSRG